MSKAMLNVVSKEAEDYMVVTLDLTSLMQTRGFLTESKALEYKNVLKIIKNRNAKPEKAGSLGRGLSSLADAAMLCEMFK